MSEPYNRYSREEGREDWRCTDCGRDKRTSWHDAHCELRTQEMRTITDLDRARAQVLAITRRDLALEALRVDTIAARHCMVTMARLAMDITHDPTDAQVDELADIYWAEVYATADPQYDPRVDHPERYTDGRPV